MAVIERLLITGAAGRMGRLLRSALAAECRRLRLTDVQSLGEAAGHEELVQCDMGNPAAVRLLVEGVDAVVHLAGFPREASWDVILANNLVPAIHLWEAALSAGTRRIVFASSNHAVGFYPRAERIDHTVPQRPDTRYGVAKAFMEDMARFYADKHGIAAMGLRIGAFRDTPGDARQLSTWISPADLVTLVRVGLTADYHFEIVYGASDNLASWWDNHRATALGYCPQDSADAWKDSLAGNIESDPIARRFQGGQFAADGFSRRCMNHDTDP
jgi:uronate dehydrogenase